MLDGRVFVGLDGEEDVGEVSEEQLVGLFEGLHYEVQHWDGELH